MLIEAAGATTDATGPEVEPLMAGAGAGGGGGGGGGGGVLEAPWLPLMVVVLVLARTKYLEELVVGAWTGWLLSRIIVVVVAGGDDEVVDDVDVGDDGGEGGENTGDGVGFGGMGVVIVLTR